MVEQWISDLAAGLGELLLSPARLVLSAVDLQTGTLT
jgi:hypothetical protein